MGRRPRTLLAAVWIPLALAGCRGLPDDHYLHTYLARTASKWRRNADPARYGLSIRRRVAGLRRTVEAIDPLRAARLAKARRAPARLLGDLRDDLARFPARARADLAPHLERVARWVPRHLADPRSTTRELLSPARALRRARRSLAEAPDELGLNRRILPSPTDPERQTGIAGHPRRETLIERILRRLRP